jgi:hypothetical protein
MTAWCSCSRHTLGSSFASPQSLQVRGGLTKAKPEVCAVHEALEITQQAWTPGQLEPLEDLLRELEGGGCSRPGRIGSHYSETGPTHETRP